MTKPSPETIEPFARSITEEEAHLVAELQELVKDVIEVCNDVFDKNVWVSCSDCVDELRTGGPQLVL